MSRNLIILMILAVVSFVFGCNDKAPSCSTLSWGETKVEEPGFDLKYSAGNQCENINDYWDVDIEDIISKIQNMRFVKNDTCKIPDDETGEGIEFECPEFVPETIEFSELTGCRFGTPPSEESLCLADPLDLYFRTNSFFETVYWTFDVENPEFYFEDQFRPEPIGSKVEEKTMAAKFLNEDLDKVAIRFNWTEIMEDVETKKEMSLEYSVEVKE